MSGESVLWREVPDEDGDEREVEAQGGVDETFSARRLRRWLGGMFGGGPAPEPEQPEREPDA
jgi:hypothetical protein